MTKERHDTDIDGATIVDNPEGATDHEDEDDDVGLVDEAVEQGGEDLPGLRSAVDKVERVGEHHLAAIDRVAEEFAGGHHPGEHRRQYDKREDYGKSMRYAFHAFQSVSECKDTLFSAYGKNNLAEWQKSRTFAVGIIDKI